MCVLIWYITVHTCAVHGNHTTSSAYVPYSKASTDDHRPVGMLLHFPMVVTVLLALENSTVSKTSLPLNLTPTQPHSHSTSLPPTILLECGAHFCSLHSYLHNISSFTHTPHTSSLTHHTMLIPLTTSFTRYINPFIIAYTTIRPHISSTHYPVG